MCQLLERLLSCSLGKPEVKTSIGLFWAESPVQLFSWEECLRFVIRETSGSRFLPRNINYYWRGHKDCLLTSTVGKLFWKQRNMLESVHICLKFLKCISLPIL